MSLTHSQTTDQKRGIQAEAYDGRLRRVGGEQQQALVTLWG